VALSGQLFWADVPEYGAYGPRLQVAMFEAAEALPEVEVLAFADRARAVF